MVTTKNTHKKNGGKDIRNNHIALRSKLIPFKIAVRELIQKKNQVKSGRNSWLANMTHKWKMLAESQFPISICSQLGSSEYLPQNQWEEQACNLQGPRVFTPRSMISPNCRQVPKWSILLHFVFVAINVSSNIFTWKYIPKK